MSQLFVQSKGVFDSGATSTVAATIAASGSGNLLIAICGSSNSNTQTITGVSGGGGNTFTQVPSSRATEGTSRFSDLWYLPNCAAGITTVTATFSANNIGKILWVMEFSGEDAAGLIDQTSIKTGASSTNPTAQAFTTTNANDVIVAGFICQSTFTTADTPWIALADIPDGCGACYQIVSATASYSASVNQTPAGVYCVSQTSFKAAVTPAALWGSSLLLGGVGT